MAGFTGEKKDKAGRNTCWKDGKRVPCPKEGKAPKGKAQSVKADDIKADIKETLAKGATPADVERIASSMAKLGQQDINALKKELALKVGGKKEAQARAVAEKALGAKPAEKAKGGEAVLDDIKKTLAKGATPADVERIAASMAKLPQGDINAIKKELAVKVGGKKEAQAKAIAEKALANSKPAPAPKPVAKPAPAPAPAPKKSDPREAAKTSPQVDKADAILKSLDQEKLVNQLGNMNAYEIHEFKLRHGLIEQGDFQNEPVESVAKRALEKEKPAPALPRFNAEALKRVDRGLETSTGLSDEQKKEYRAASERVIKNMPPKAALKLFKASSINFFADADSMKEAIIAAFPEHKRAEVAKKLGEGKHLGGIHIPQGDGKLYLDGGRTGEVAEVARRANQSIHAYEIYAHEFSHQVDGPKFEHSRSAEWQEAWKEEMAGKQLNVYSSTKDYEGWAEFGRLLYSGDHDLNQVKAKYPKCFAYWQKQGFAPEVGASKQAMENLPDIFSEHIELDEDGTHADLLR